MAGPGRPKGLPKTGGRKKGVGNRATVAKMKAIAESGLTPLEFFIQAMRDEQRDYSQRLEAAKAAAPFCHARLTSIEHGGQSSSPIKVVFSESDKRLL